ncbi:MAG: hypothetical protein JNM17_28205, partial [Archangium sp.]|nr:hypothetical protein [Archangium sp.]
MLATPFPTFTLTGVADDATIIRLYVDEACAGPVLREVSAETLRAGVELELVPRALNPFTARAYSPAGVRSDCSDVVHVQSTPLDPPPVPTLQAVKVGSRPGGPFRLFGLVALQPTVQVRLFRDQCGGTLVRAMTPEEFEEGTLVVVPPDAYTLFFAQSVDATAARSACASVTVMSDSMPPPSATIRVASPNPVNGGFAAIAVGGFEVQRSGVYEHPHCEGGSSWCDATFSECVLVLGLNTDVVEWSVRVEDGFGNGRCVEGTEVLLRDSGPTREQAPELELFRASEFSPWTLSARVQVWTRFTFVQFYDAADCTGPAERNLSPWDAMRRTAVDPGSVWSARMGVVMPRGVVEFGKCSNTVRVP